MLLKTSAVDVAVLPRSSLRAEALIPAAAGELAIAGLARLAVRFLSGELPSAASPKVYASSLGQSTGWLVSVGGQRSGPLTSIWDNSERPSQHRSFLRDRVRPLSQLHDSSNSPTVQPCSPTASQSCSPRWPPNKSPAHSLPDLCKKSHPSLSFLSPALRTKD